MTGCREAVEHEGTQLLTRRGIPVPRGSLWPALPEQVSGDLMVKAQTVGGGRGKGGCGLRGAAYSGSRVPIPFEVAAL
jgi:succinyl-CoA synthetase beta subunit